MFGIKYRFNSKQCTELSKSLFNLGNIAAATLMFSQVVAYSMDASLFILGCFCLLVAYAVGILLLNNERNVL